MSLSKALPESCPHCGGDMPRWQNKSGLCSAKCAKDRREMWTKCGVCLMSVGFTCVKASVKLGKSKHDLARFLVSNNLSAREIGGKVRSDIRIKRRKQKAANHLKQVRASRKEITGFATTQGHRDLVKRRYEAIKGDYDFRKNRKNAQKKYRKRIYGMETPEQKVKRAFYRRMRKFVQRGWRQEFAEICGCSQVELRKHLESQFREGMSWDNYGIHGWHIDHIIPCSSFDFTSEYQIKICFNWKNLRPLWAKENIAKSNRIMEPQSWLPLSA